MRRFDTSTDIHLTRAFGHKPVAGAVRGGPGGRSPEDNSTPPED